MRPHGGAMPAIDEVGRGDTKTPPLWHTAAKLPRSRWCRRQLPRPHPAHGLVHGTREGSFVRLAGGRGDSRIESEFDGVVQHLGPPSYPPSIATGGARPAAVLFEVGRVLALSRRLRRARQRRLAGRPRMSAPIRRGDIVSDGFRAAFASSPLAAEGALVKSEGYAATPLTGVWANYPYCTTGASPRSTICSGRLRAPEDFLRHGRAAPGS